VVEKADLDFGWTRPLPEEAFAYGYQAEMRHFVECVRDGRTPRETYEDGWIVNLVLDAGYRSMRLDAVFNVAGISGRLYGDGPLHECTEEGWDTTLGTNVRSMFLVCRAALRQMLRQEVAVNGLRGTILNMSSVLAFAPEAPHFATHAYAASKGAILALSRALAAYYAPHRIRVNAIAPGLVRTPMSARAQGDPEVVELMKTKQPLLGDLLEAEDVARAALFLLGDDARVVTGDTLVVDGGWTVSG
jgi:NAD(P)-dependent dehydrogenase (short-subunit alcohol dehydrogenase family)